MEFNGEAQSAQRGAGAGARSRSSSRSRSHRWPLLCVAASLAACAGDGTGLDENGRPDGEDSDVLQPTFQSIQEQVLTPACTGCHAGAAAPLGLRLEAGSSYALLVNAPSVEVPALQRVQPGNPDASYLIQKLEGTAAVGARMPLNSPPLPASTIAVVRQWIANGAASGSLASSGKGRFLAARLQAVYPLEGESVLSSAAEASSAAPIVVSSSARLDTSLLQSQLVTLRASGGDGEFQRGNETEVPVSIEVRSYEPTVLAIAPLAGTFTLDLYELRIGGSGPVALADLDGRVIDGDGDGIPGGDFVLHFTAEASR